MQYTIPVTFVTEALRLFKIIYNLAEYRTAVQLAILQLAVEGFWLPRTFLVKTAVLIEVANPI